jgi:hypothetical protein
MGRRQTRIIGAAAALLAAGMAGFSLRPGEQPATVAARNPAADVRTEVIRRTVHIVRHTHARHATAPRGRVSATVPSPGSRPVSPVRTSASKSRAGGSAGTVTAATAVTTRTSASHALANSSPGGRAPAGAPIATRTSSHGSSPAGAPSQGTAPVTTRTSSHGSVPGSGGPVRTRTSGGGERGDGGEGGD